MRFIVFYCFAVVFLCSSCEQKEVPPPPIERAELVISILSSFRDRDYTLSKEVLQKFEKHSVHNDFFPQLKKLSDLNKVIQNVQIELSAYRLDRARSILRLSIARLSRQPALIEVSNEIQQLIHQRTIIQTLEKAQTALTVDEGIKELQQSLAENTQAQKIFKDYLQKKQGISKQLHHQEQLQGWIDLWCDVDDAIAQQRAYWETGLAEMEATLPQMNIEKLYPFHFEGTPPKPLLVP